MTVTHLLTERRELKKAFSPFYSALRLVWSAEKFPLLLSQVAHTQKYVYIITCLLYIFQNGTFRKASGTFAQIALSWQAQLQPLHSRIIPVQNRCTVDSPAEEFVPDSFLNTH